MRKKKKLGFNPDTTPEEVVEGLTKFYTENAASPMQPKDGRVLFTVDLENATLKMYWEE